VDFNHYQNATDKTAIYPSAGKGNPAALNYVLVALGGEAGEVLNKWKKYLRDGTSLDELYPLIADELGDILWYCARAALEMGYSFSDVADQNLFKLENRQKREVLSGSGDNR
jgi:NTP pyrophosphatase (non-canonical NTP hydrolase)